mmetsp:Transcript_21907/g.35460  ORF Transcript_21907/g.35460 Transcript_21907/m.35460 type:complete len:84 (-) Transcript_21907:181-432(-)
MKDTTETLCRATLQEIGVLRKYLWKLDTGKLSGARTFCMGETMEKERVAEKMKKSFMAGVKMQAIMPMNYGHSPVIQRTTNTE